MLKTVVPYAQRNLWSRHRDGRTGVPITTVDAAIAYRQRRASDAVPAGHDFHAVNDLLFNGFARCR